MAIKISDSKITIDAVDVTQYVKNYNLYTGPDQPFPMVELELSQAKNVRTLIIPEEGKELHISAAGVGTFIISSVELEEETYNIIGVHHSFRIKTIVTEEPYEGTPDEIFERIARDLGYSDIVISTKSYSSIKIYAGETIFNILNYIAELTASKWFFTETSAYLVNWSNTPERPRNIPEPPEPPQFNGNTWVVDASGAGDFLTIQEAIESPAVISGDTIDLRNDDAGIPYELRFHGKKLKYLLNGYNVTDLYCAANSICENGTILNRLGCPGLTFIYNCNINHLYRAWGDGGSVVFNSTINNFLGGTHRYTYCYNCEINGLYFSSTYDTDGVILFDNCEFTRDFSISSTHTTPRKIYFIECIGQNLTIDCPPDDVYLINNTFENVTYDANNVIRYEPPESYNILINYEPDPGLPIPSPPATPEFNGNTWVVDETGAGDFLTITEALESESVVTGDIIDLRNDDMGREYFLYKGLKYLLNGHTVHFVYTGYTSIFSVYENGTIDILRSHGNGILYNCHIKEIYLQWTSGQVIAYNCVIDSYTGVRWQSSRHQYYNCLINAESYLTTNNVNAVILYDNCDFTQDFSISSTHTTPRPIWFINCRGRNLNINCPADNIYLVNNLFENINIEAGNLIYRRDFGEPKGNTFPITQPETWVNLDDVINKVNVIYEMGTVTASDAESIAKYGESAKTYRNLSTFSTLAETITEEDAQRVADNILSRRKEPIDCMAYNIKERTLEDGAKAWEQKYAYYSKAEIIDGFSNTHLIDVPLALIVHKYPQYIATVSWGRGNIPKLSEEIASLNNEIADRAISGGITGELSNRPVALQVYGNQTLNEFDENTFTGFYLGKRFDSSGNPLYNWAGLNNGVEQVKMDTDGKLKAGENNLLIDENGLQIYIGPHNRNRIRLLDEINYPVLSIYGNKSGTERKGTISSLDFLELYALNKIELRTNYETRITSPLIQKTEWEYETEPRKTVFENVIYTIHGVEETLTRFEITEDGISCEGNRLDASKCNTIRFRVGTTDPDNPKEGDAYIKRYPDNTFQLRIYDGSTWRYENL